MRLLRAVQPSVRIRSAMMHATWLPGVLVVASVYSPVQNRCPPELPAGAVVRDPSDGTISVIQHNSRYHVGTCNQCGGQWCLPQLWAVNDPCVVWSYPHAGDYDCSWSAVSPAETVAAALRETRAASVQLADRSLRYRFFGDHVSLHHVSVTVHLTTVRERGGERRAQQCAAILFDWPAEKFLRPGSQ